MLFNINEKGEPLVISFAPFLSPEAIKHLQENERCSDQSQKRTAQQIEAIYTSGQNILVSASAGSGKTFVMVERILDKILRGVSIDRLLSQPLLLKQLQNCVNGLKTNYTHKLLKLQIFK